MTLPPTISLTNTVGLGIIIEHASGASYSNQAGGASCLQPSTIGFYVPLRNDCSVPDGRFVSPEDDLIEYFVGPAHRGTGATAGLSQLDADFIDQVLQRADLLSAISVDRGRLRESHEAWVHILVHADEAKTAPIFAGFGPYPRHGVLTWSNSD